MNTEGGSRTWSRNTKPLRSLESVSGAQVKTTVEEECSAQRNAFESGRAYYDDATSLPLDPKMVADAVKEELMFLRMLQVYHDVLVSYLDKSGLKAIGTRWIYTNKDDAANPFVRARLVPQETK